MLSNKSIVVTGASGGLGEGVTRTLLAHGAQVAGVARSWSKGAPAEPGFLPVEADVASEAGAASAMAAALQAFSRLDAAVHLVGGFAMDGPLRHSAPATLDRMFEMNVRTTFVVFQAALAAMPESGVGRLIAIGSRSGLEPAAGMAAYAASKAALHMLVRSVALELKGSLITVNALLPSTIDTPANRAAMPKADPERWVKPASIGESIAWLCSDAAQDVSGALIPVYGNA